MLINLKKFKSKVIYGQDSWTGFFLYICIWKMSWNVPKLGWVLMVKVSRAQPTKLLTMSVGNDDVPCSLHIQHPLFSPLPNTLEKISFPPLPNST